MKISTLSLLLLSALFLSCDGNPQEFAVISNSSVATGAPEKYSQLYFSLSRERQDKHGKALHGVSLGPVFQVR